MRRLIPGVVLLVWTLGLGNSAAGTGQEIPLEDKEQILHRQIDIYRDYLPAQSDNADLHYNLGTKFYELSQVLKERSGGFFRTAEKEEFARQSEEFLEKAIDHLTQAVQLDPSLGRAYFNLGVSYFVLGSGEKAILNMRKAEARYMQKNDPRGVAKARKALRDWFDTFGYRPEDFTLPPAQAHVSDDLFY
ncbi:MAG: tetratricopeptide repeat protein [Nitrospinaceae bacterium]|nr:tetratricopeptide repeat protein [Nitrospinaceae bacterium]NIR57003.1 tetratricopeptide repeat protein [Nitrospinaceae bacterium]NIS87460.1 tetratricopeptide repeat protein [Nitrospinaceae bacterium]NIT84309.1 tetratricopeptide repeat protein [Nitrospinaceae bacterium]NIU46499.1 tetratricopeptide repeat protein [Nitrospinaceae bacterium]